MSEPLSFHVKSSEKLFKYYLINVGQGLMFLIILPDDYTILYDCNLTEDNKDKILSYLESILPKNQIDLFINSHRDDDHIRGLKFINEKFPILSIWDSGQTGDSTQSKTYQYYMQLRRRLTKQGENSVKIPKPSITPLFNREETKIYCLNSSYKFNKIKDCLLNSDVSFLSQEQGLDEVKKSHTNCIVLRVCFNDISIILTGDSDYLIWRDEIVPNFGDSGLLQSNILIASHHGSKTFFTDEKNDTISIVDNPDNTYLKALDYIKPAITLISCGNYPKFHHPNKNALKIYKSQTANEQVYTTNEKGHFVGFIKRDGNWGIIPSRFSSYKSDIFKIKCKSNGENIINNSCLSIGCILNFSAKPIQHGIFEPFSDVVIRWEVSNSGTGTDSDHHEIYYGKKGNLNFSRELRYKGRHLLRCYFYNQKKGIRSQQIFVVDGISEVM